LNDEDCPVAADDQQYDNVRNKQEAEDNAESEQEKCDSAYAFD
jgi:hypothetical protein